jgi:hypothetical protein
MRGYRLTNRTLAQCPDGFIKRAAYVRTTKRGKRVHVPEQCIRDVGAPGKGLRDGPGIGPLRKGELAKFGYSDVQHRGVTVRRAALAKAVAEYGPLSVWRKLNAVYVYTRRISPASSRIFKEDMDWIRSTYGVRAFAAA